MEKTLSTISLGYEKITKSPDLIHQEDFKRNEEAAKEWAKSHRERLEKDLTRLQKSAIEEMHNPTESNNLNMAIKDTGNNLDALPTQDNAGNPDDELINRQEVYKFNRDQINDAFKHLSGKIPNKMFVYKELNPLQFGFTAAEFTANDSINIDAALFIEEKFKYGFVHEFSSVTASEKLQPLQEENRIQLKIELPKGTNIIPIGDSDELYIPPHTLTVTKEMSLIVKNGVTYLQIDAKYDPIESATNEIIPIIDSIQKAYNSLWNTELGFLPEEQNIFEFRINDIFASASASIYSKAIQDTILNEQSFLNVNRAFLFNVTKFVGQANGKVIFTDILAGYIKELLDKNIPSLENIEYLNDSQGITNEDARVSVINGFIDKSAPRNFADLKDTFIHELTHLQDRRLGIILYGKETNYSNNNDLINGHFLDIFKREKNNIPEPFFEYARSEPGEYLAEIHSFMYSNRTFNKESSPGLPDIKNKKLYDIVSLRVPDTVKWIKQYLYQ